MRLRNLVDICIDFVVKSTNKDLQGMQMPLRLGQGGIFAVARTPNHASDCSWAFKRISKIGDLCLT